MIWARIYANLKLLFIVLFTKIHMLGNRTSVYQLMKSCRGVRELSLRMRAWEQVSVVCCWRSLLLKCSNMKHASNCSLPLFPFPPYEQDPSLLNCCPWGYFLTKLRFSHLQISLLSYRQPVARTNLQIMTGMCWFLDEVQEYFWNHTRRICRHPFDSLPTTLWKRGIHFSTNVKK